MTKRYEVVGVNWPIFLFGAVAAYSVIHTIGLLWKSKSLWANFTIDRRTSPLKFWGFILFDLVILALSVGFAISYSS